jgi:hypothetical protein
MTSRNLVAALLAATVLVAGAAPASAQSYYMREKIVGVPTMTYVATYGSYGACTGTTQTAPVATCRNGSGASVDLSLCQPVSKPCEVPIKQSDYYSCTGAQQSVEVTATQSGIQRNDLGSAASESAAIEKCNAFPSDATRPYAACGWNPVPKLAFLWRAPKDLIWKTGTGTLYHACSVIR